MKILFLNVFIMLTLATIRSRAQFDIKTNDGAITICGYRGQEVDLVLPTRTNGLDVTSIGPKAFINFSMMESITIPASITNIGEDAFLDCGELSNIIFLGNAPRSGPDVFTENTNACVYYFRGTSGWGPNFDHLATFPLSRENLEYKRALESWLGRDIDKSENFVRKDQVEYAGGVLGLVAILFTATYTIIQQRGSRREHAEKAHFEMINTLYAGWHVLHERIQHEWRFRHLLCLTPREYELVKVQIKTKLLSEKNKSDLAELAVKEKMFAIEIFIMFEQVYYQWECTDPNTHKNRKKFLKSMLGYFTERVMRNPRLFGLLEEEKTQEGLMLHMEPETFRHLYCSLTGTMIPEREKSVLRNVSDRLFQHAAVECMNAFDDFINPLKKLWYGKEVAPRMDLYGLRESFTRFSVRDFYDVPGFVWLINDENGFLRESLDKEIIKRFANPANVNKETVLQDIEDFLKDLNLKLGRWKIKAVEEFHAFDIKNDNKISQSKKDEISHRLEKLKPIKTGLLPISSPDEGPEDQKIKLLIRFMLEEKYPHHIIPAIPEADLGGPFNPH